MKDAASLLKKINILVIDDMEAMRSMLTACLRNLGAEKIKVASDGEKAWSLIKNRKVHMILCDWDMPNMTGIDLLKRVRANGDYKHIPFLLLTATTEKDRVISAIHAGVNEYLSKPFQPKELDYRVLKLLGKVKLD